jgi:WD40 repeat protein
MISPPPDQPTAMPSLVALENAAVKAERRAARRTRWVVIALAAVIALAMGLIVWSARESARQDERIADSIAFSPGGERFISRAGYLVDGRTDTPVARLVSEPVSTAVFSAGGDIAVATPGDTVSIFNSSGTRIAAFRTEAKPESLGFSPDGSRIVAVLQNGAATLWTLQGEPVARIMTDVPIRYAEFSPDNRLMAAGTSDDTLLIWDVPNKAPISQIKLQAVGSEIMLIGFRSDSQQILAVYGWDVASGREVSEFLGTSSRFL